MKIGASGGGAPPVAGAGSRSPGAPAAGFSPSTESAAPAAAAAGPAVAAGVAGLEALLALQETAGPLERRRRAVARAGRLLDGLEAVKLALLDGAGADAALDGLARTAAETRETFQDLGQDLGQDPGQDPGRDSGLGDVLDEIETRAAVEIAKREVRRHAA